MIETVIHTIFNAIVPLSIPVIAGAFLVYFQNLNIKPILTVVLYFLTPGLIFDTILKADIYFREVLDTVLYSSLYILLMWFVALLISKLFKLPAPESAGLTLMSTFTNSVNYGLPLILLTFGQVGLEKAAVYVILQTILVNTIGVFFAARSHFSAKDAFISIFKLPAVYAVLLVLPFKMFNWDLPNGFEIGFEMVAMSYSPIVLCVLGAQMMRVTRTKLEKHVQTTYYLGLIIRTFIAPIVAFLALFILNIDGILASVFFILSCMPVAVNAAILAEKFDASPLAVSKAIFWTTLASFIVLPICIVIIS
ncbi:AEC family transporter [Pallidibacillus pasinlerensis]|uniref:AEC family transporter n=1 Tax=Pallidibacillus pasinlerensis TaxID=2703818 RepID=A0ABX0AB74_9BACI|nr:AEC family transporter [Pallidibacillus pasinlerensis]NCU18428.1 AEC family transporter [Pallidibacillus pasinlerensis]